MFVYLEIKHLKKKQCLKFNDATVPTVHLAFVNHTVLCHSSTYTRSHYYLSYIYKNINVI